jgi:hypothetical protein
MLRLTRYYKTVGRSIDAIPCTLSQIVMHASLKDLSIIQLFELYAPTSAKSLKVFLCRTGNNPVANNTEVVGCRGEDSG